MLAITLLAVGRMKAGPERELLTRYIDRAATLCRPAGLSGIASREIEESRARSMPERRREEAAALRAEMRAGARLVALDETGRSVGSTEFAALIGRSRDEGLSDLALAIGGPDGLDDELRRRAHLVIGFGAATFPHQLVRVMLAEQVYRALTILVGHPYHRV